MALLRSLSDFKQAAQSAFDGNEESLSRYGKFYTNQLKTYLVESNRPLSEVSPLVGEWRPLETRGWHAIHSPEIGNQMVLDASSPRLWRVFSFLGATESDALIEHWIDSNRGLDHAWLSRQQMMRWSSLQGWEQRGVGLRFGDGLASDDEQGNFSLKAWHGAARFLPDIEAVLSRAQERFAIYSVRWQKKSSGVIETSAEIYSNGKITINRSADIDQALAFTSVIADRYEAALAEASKRRDESFSPFELTFTQELDLDAFTDTVTRAVGPMKLWLVEVDQEPGFRRFRGVDMHTWDRIVLDVAPSYAYLTIPGRGCVNAAPRLATIQGEEIAGRTSVYYEGDEMFG